MISIGPHYTSDNENIEVPTDPVTEAIIRVKITDIEPYNQNLRITKNAKYEEIKESIRTRGLDQSFSITRKPGESNYTIARGGNTRLTILKELHSQSGEDKYLWQELKFVPWDGERTALISHLIENGLRADFTFYERARGVMLIRNELQRGRDDNQPPSLSALSEFLSTKGYNLSRSSLSRMIYAVETLLPLIPEALAGGLGGANIRTIKQLCNGAEKVLIHGGCLDTQRNSVVVQAALADSDCKKWSAKEFTVQLVEHLSLELNYDKKHVQLALRGSLTNESLSSIPIPHEKNTIPAAITTQTTTNSMASSATSSNTHSSKPQPVSKLRTVHCENAQHLARLINQAALVQPLEKLGFGYLVTNVPSLNDLEQLSCVNPIAALRTKAVWFHLINLSGCLVGLNDDQIAAILICLLPEDSMLRKALQMQSTDALVEVSDVFLSPSHWSCSLVGLLTDKEWRAVTRLEGSYRALVAECESQHTAWGLAKSQ